MTIAIFCIGIWLAVKNAACFCMRGAVGRARVEHGLRGERD